MTHKSIEEEYKKDILAAFRQAINDEIRIIGRRIGNDKRLINQLKALRDSKIDLPIDTKWLTKRAESLIKENSPLFGEERVK